MTYTGGPFVVPNTTAQVNGIPDCTLPMSCDDFQLTVNVPADPNKQVKVKIEWPISAADFDLYIFAGFNPPPDAVPVATAATSSDPEVAFLPTGVATYTIRVVPFAPAGQSYTGTVSLEDVPPPPPPATGPAPRYKNYPAPSDLAGAGSAGEPSIGIDWNPNVPALKHDSVNTGGVTFFTANLNEFRVSFDDCSSPAKNPNTLTDPPLWEDVTSPTEGETTLDPIGFVDRRFSNTMPPTSPGRVFQSQLAGASSIMAFSDDDGNNWTQSQGSGQPAGVDHQTVGGGPYNENAVPPPVHPLYVNQIYYASQDIATAFAARSDNGGLTFGPGVPMWNLTQCGGLHGHVKVGPDGTVYVPNKGCSGKTGVAVSEDNGVTWTVRTIPDSTTGDTDPSVGFGADGTVYLGYQAADGRPRIAVSQNHGQTWSASVDVGQGFIKNCVFRKLLPATVPARPSVFSARRLPEITRTQITSAAFGTFTSPQLLTAESPTLWSTQRTMTRSKSVRFALVVPPAAATATCSTLMTLRSTAWAGSRRLTRTAA